MPPPMTRRFTATGRHRQMDTAASRHAPCAKAANAPRTAGAARTRTLGERHPREKRARASRRARLNTPKAKPNLGIIPDTPAPGPNASTANRFDLRERPTPHPPHRDAEGGCLARPMLPGESSCRRRISHNALPAQGRHAENLPLWINGSRQVMSWEREVAELERQREFAKEMGGADSVAFHHSRGRLTVRERVALLSKTPAPSTRSAPSPAPPSGTATRSRTSSRRTP